MRLNISQGSEFEKKIGYSRAVLQDGWVFVAGTTGFDYDAMTISDDPAEQCAQTLRNIEWALGQVGCSLRDVVRMRFYFPNADDFEPCWPVLRDAFGAAPPAGTMVVSGLIDPRMKLEIEVTAKQPGG